MATSLSPQEKEIILILSKGNPNLFNSYMGEDDRFLRLVIRKYLERKKVVDEINKSLSTKITDIDDLELIQNKEAILDVLLKHLIYEDTPYHVKLAITRVLATYKDKQGKIIPVLAKEIRNADPDYKDEVNSANGYLISIGNIFLKQLSDQEALVLFDLLKDSKYKRNTFLLESMGNLKDKHNKELAKKVIVGILDENETNLEIIYATLRAIRKLKIKELAPQVKKYILSSDKQIKKEAQLIINAHV